MSNFILTESEVSYTIQDENGHYVHANSIKKIGKEFYYLPYQNLKDGCIIYTNKDRAEQALYELKKYNLLGALGHRFSVKQVVC